MNHDSLPDVFTCPGALYIYKIECSINGKVYIGRTASPRHRKETHFGTLKRNRHKNASLQNDFNRFGIDAFSFEILEKCFRNRSNSECIDGGREKAYMEKYNSHSFDSGYNFNDPIWNRKWKDSPWTRTKS